MSSLRRATCSLQRNAGLVLVPAAAVLAAKVHEMFLSGELEAELQQALKTGPQLNMATALVCAALLAALLLYRRMTARRPVYLLDFATAIPPPEWKFPREAFLRANALNPEYTLGEMEFQERILQRCGLGEETSCPPWLAGYPFFFDMSHSRLEYEVMCFSAVEELLNRTGVSPKQIHAVIVNSSLFNPTPSLSAMIMNRFKMRAGTVNYNLGGMGCSAGVIAIDLARKVLQDEPECYVLVVSHENITNNWYPGCDRSMLVPNCIFRANGAAMLLTNKPTEAWRAKYWLRNLVRVNMAGSEKGYNCVYQMEDEEGDLGVRLSKDLTEVAGKALMINLGRLGPLILPASEKFKFAVNLLKQRMQGKAKVKPYVPNFKAAVDHICIHSGGRAVIDGMQRALKLSDADAEPSRATLYRWGNVSSSSIWYELGFVESFVGLRRGEKVWQLAFGSGFKCNSAVWVANRAIKFQHPCWAGFDLAKMRAELKDLAEQVAKERAAAKAAGVKGDDGL